jgi:PD-(D/E)XK nuclease superfamily
MKLKFHVPTQQYGFLEIEGTEKDLKKMEATYNEYAETPLAFKKGVYKEVLTFTGEKVLYDEENHSYTDLDGNKLISGSQFKKQFDTPFDKEKILPLVEKKYGVSSATIDAMWAANSLISTTFGNAIHLTMEQYFRNRENGCEDKNYHLPKQIFLKNIVDTFPLKDLVILPELMVSCVKKKMVGQIDGLVVTGDKEGYIIDYKTDAGIQKNLTGHFIQLSFYARILKEHGWSITKVEVWNWTEKWERYEHEVIDVMKVTKESIKQLTKEYGKEKSSKVTSAEVSKSRKGKDSGVPESTGVVDAGQESA